MSLKIRPLEPTDLPELSGFLTGGFRTPRDAEFAAPEILAWKYFDPTGILDGQPRSLVALADGKIVGHLGLCFTRFRDTANPALDVSTLHMIDWLGSPEQRGVGVRVMRRAGPLTATQYGIGGTDAARRVTDRSRYELVAPVPIYRRVLRHGHAFRKPGQGPSRGLADATKGLLRSLTHRPGRPVLELRFRDMKQFGPEVEEIVSACPTRMIHTARPPALLNHLLRHPRNRIRGGLLLQDDRVRGFGVLSVVLRDGVRYGQIVEAFVDAPEEPGLLAAALQKLTDELRIQKADLVTTFGGTPWMARALRDCGYFTLTHVNLYLRDPNRLIPRDAHFYVTPVEADYAYT
ncbi:hypothetical protein BH23PLA1_BH23PLA1_19850 [soil metagenome]